MNDVGTTRGLAGTPSEAPVLMSYAYDMEFP